MKKIRWLFIPLLFSLSNCVSIQNYLSNRAFDLSDIVTIGGEANTYGASAWLWCFGGGLQIAQDGKGLGMRNGYIGSYRTGGNRKLGKLKMGNSFFLMNSQEHIPEAYKTSRSMRKNTLMQIFYLFFLPAYKVDGGAINIIQIQTIIIIIMILLIHLLICQIFAMRRLTSNFHWAWELELGLELTFRKR